MTIAQKLREKRFRVPSSRQRRSKITSPQAQALLDKEIAKAQDTGVPGEVVIQLTMNGGNIVGAKAGFVPADQRFIRSVDLSEEI